MIIPSTSDQTTTIVRDNLARIRLLAVAGPAFLDERQVDRLAAVLRNFQRFGLRAPVVVAGVHNDAETAAAEDRLRQLAPLIATWRIARQTGHTEMIGTGLQVYRELIDPEADRFTAKRHMLVLARRGGQGQPQFVSPFTGGAGTTCGEWTRPVYRKPSGEVIKGFLKAALAVGFCPVECPFCYLQMAYTDGMTINLNWEDLAEELKREWPGFPYPINFSETSGVVEYDEWFAGPNGEGSMVQFLIDACADVEVIPFLLTKIRFPPYLRYSERVQVGISAMPEEIRRTMAPHGSPTDELVRSLAAAVDAGASDPVVRLFFMWKYREAYSAMLRRLRDYLGESGWGLTLDIPRFTARTLATIGKRYPQLAETFATELGDGTGTLPDLIAGNNDKKIRPSLQRQTDAYQWVRRELNQIGCQDVSITACKGNPDELRPLVHAGVIDAMPCACYGVNSTELVQLQPVRPNVEADDV